MRRFRIKQEVWFRLVDGGPRVAGVVEWIDRDDRIFGIRPLHRCYKAILRHDGQGRIEPREV